MATAEQDTEITLGTGRMLAIFFAFVLVCAFFFPSVFRWAADGEYGRIQFARPDRGSAANVVRPTAAKNNAAQATPQAQSQTSSNDFSFYKAVGEKSAMLP